MNRFAFLLAAQLLGLISFTITIKILLNSTNEGQLPIYQGLLAIYSLTGFGLLYSNSRKKIHTRGIIIGAIILFICILIFYSRSTEDIYKLTLMSINFMLWNYVQLRLIAQGRENKYFIALTLQSALFPFQIIATEQGLTAFTIIAIAASAGIIKYQSSNRLDPHSTATPTDNNSLLEVIKSLILQSPILITPLFDQQLSALIGPQLYASYILASKYIVGPVNLLFAQQQHKVLMGEPKNLNYAPFIIIIIGTALALICVLTITQYTLWLGVFFLALGNNISSLILRSSLITQKISNISLVIPMTSICIYVSFVYELIPIAADYSIVFILFLYITGASAASGILIIKRFKKIRHTRRRLE